MARLTIILCVLYESVDWALMIYRIPRQPQSAVPAFVMGILCIVGDMPARIPSYPSLHELVMYCHCIWVCLTSNVPPPTHHVYYPCHVLCLAGIAFTTT